VTARPVEAGTDLQRRRYSAARHHRPIPTGSSRAGFTLIELLVALTIFAVLSLLAYGGLASVLETGGQLRERSARLGELQRAVTWLVNDLSQLAGRPVRDGFGDPQPALRAQPELEPPLVFTRGGHPNPAGTARSSLQRIAYRRDENRLVRLAWAVLDRAPESTPLEQPLLDGVTDFEVRLLGANEQWLTFWPPAGEPPDTAQLPRAVEVTLEVEGFGRITRLVLTGG